MMKKKLCVGTSMCAFTKDKRAEIYQLSEWSTKVYCGVKHVSGSREGGVVGCVTIYKRHNDEKRRHHQINNNHRGKT